MTKESEEKSKNNDNADQTVSTPTEISQTNCEKNITVESNVNKSVNEANPNRKSEMSGKSENNVEKFNLDNSEQKSSGVQNDISGIKNQNENKKEDTEEDDVPGDFFDDFLKEDFMLGLDIVDDDAWEKELVVEAPKNDKNSPIPTNTVDTKKKKGKIKIEKKSKPSKKAEHTEKPRISLSGDKRHKQKKKKQDDREKLEDKEKHTKSKEKLIDADEFDIRRDPEKTKRDIEQYKAKCEKDKEKKIISEKLSLVETGLVPPGMEMEIDIEEVKRQKSRIEVESRIETREVESRIERNLPPRDLREHLRKLRSKSKSPNHRQRSFKVSASRRSASPLRKSSPKKRRTRSPGKSSSRRSPARVSPPKKSPHRRSPGRVSPSKKSPHRRSPVTGSTNTQKRSPLPFRVRRSPLPFRSPTRRSRGRSYERKSPIRRSRSHSPYYRSRRSRYSPFSRHRERSDSRDSEREKWLKRRRTRSRSPRRKREEKKSFLQEIAEKLNETRPQPVNIMPPLQPPMHYMHPQSMHPQSLAPVPPSPVPAPTPVPPPSNPQFFPPRPQLPQPQQQFDPYDQNFFIGTPQPVGPPNFIAQPQNNPPLVRFPQPKPQPQPQMPLNPLSIQPINSPNLQSSPSPAGSNISRNMNNPMPQLQGPINQINQTTVGVVAKTEDLAKLFQDKKITLSEFLAITAKPEVISTSPANLQEKIKVIQRCHEAIKILGTAEKKYTGKLVVHHTDSYQVRKEVNVSPLLKKPPVTFPFTQHQTGQEQKLSFTTFINQLLRKIGLLKEVVVDVDNDVPSNAGIQPAPRALSPPPPPSITQNRNVVQNDMRSNRSNKLTSNQLSKLIQTDVFKCENCEKRKKILYKASAVQCGGETANFSVSTQVTEEDFYKFQKTQSLASLTPAQLLARSGSNRLLDKDIFDKGPSQNNYPNRMGFMHPSDPTYSLPRYRSPSPPPLHFAPLSREELLPPMYNSGSLRVPFIGGGGRGRDIPPNLPRTLDSSRFGYNYY